MPPKTVPVEPVTAPALGKAACPRCNCWLTASFVRRDGAAKPHTEHCLNCGRWTETATGQGLDGFPADKRCAVGNTMHTHEPAPVA